MHNISDAHNPVLVWKTRDTVITAGTSWLTIGDDARRPVRIRNKEQLRELAWLLKDLHANIVAGVETKRSCVLGDTTFVARRDAQAGEKVTRFYGGYNNLVLLRIADSPLCDLQLWLAHLTGGPACTTSFDDRHDLQLEEGGRLLRLGQAALAIDDHAVRRLAKMFADGAAHTGTGTLTASVGPAEDFYLEPASAATYAASVWSAGRLLGQAHLSRSALAILARKLEVRHD